MIHFNANRWIFNIPIRTMKSHVWLIFSAVILLKAIGICDGSCYTEPKCINEIPKKLLRWKSKDYGLEIPGDVETSDDLVGDDLKTQKRANEIGRPHMKSQVDRMIRNNKNSKLPDFTIVKLDPISYQHNEQDMLIILSDVKMFNLDGYAFDDEAAQYTQTGMYERGLYNIKSKIYKEIQQKLEDKNFKDTQEGKDLRTFFDRIDLNIIPGEYTLKRRDCKWKLVIKAKFVTKQNKIEKPIVIKTNFKIQPDKTKNQQNLEIGQEPLKAKGVAEIEIRDFSFEISLDITHIDDPLRPYLDPKIRSDNLAPDLNVIYEMTDITVKNIELFSYDKDDDIPPKIEDDLEDVNQDAPTEEQVKQMENEKAQKEKEQKKRNTSKKSEQAKKETSIKDENFKKRVESHFNDLSNLIKNQRDEIRKRLCRNLLPKMAWKIMHMDSKIRLPTLFYQIIAYEDDFMEKVRLPKFSTMDWVNLGWDVASATIGNAGAKLGKAASSARSAVTSFFGGRRSNSAPAAMQALNNKKDKEGKK